MGNFTGEYESTLDDKGRFLMPVAVKKQMPDAENDFAIVRDDNCLKLYPKSKWDIILNKVSQLNDMDPKVKKFKRGLLWGNSIVSLEGSGRLKLSSLQKEHAGIKKDIVILGLLSHFEIWSKDKYNNIPHSEDSGNFNEISSEILEKYNINFND